MFQIPLLQSPCSLLQNDKNNNLHTSNVTDVPRVAPETLKRTVLSNKFPMITDMFHNKTRNNFSDMFNYTSSNSYQNHLKSSNEQYQSHDNPIRTPKENVSNSSCSGHIRQQLDKLVIQNNEDLSNLSNPDTIKSNSSVCGQSPVEVNDLKEDIWLNSSSSNDSSRNFKNSVNAENEFNDVKQRDNVENAKKGKPYKCDDCGKGFSQMRNFKYHR